MLKLFRKSLAVLLAGTLSLGMTALSAGAADGAKLVDIDLWNAVSDQASMGNVATANNPQALYNPEKNTLQIATNPVSVSGYQSGIIAAQYDQTGSGSFADVTTLSTTQVDTGTKNDGTNHTITCLSSFELTVPDYIKKTGVEFIPFKMSVPYTPMDAAVGTGFLDARLRIDWGTAKTSTLTALTPNTQMSSGSIEAVALKDAATGIALNADSSKVDAGAALNVQTVTSGTDYDTAKQALAGTADSFTLYQVTLSANGQTVDPHGAIELIFPYSGTPTMYRVNADGSKTVLKGTAASTGYSVLTTKIGFFAVVGGTKLTTGGTADPATGFTDVGNHWAAAYIQKAVDAKLFNGTTTTTFSPEQQMTCGMAITTVYRIAGQPDVTVTEPIPNVAAGAFYEKPAAWGLDKQVIGGYTPFLPEKNVTREELATMLYRCYSLSKTPQTGADLSKFSDASEISTWAQDALAWANAAGIVTGSTATTIAPADNATRAEVATMLCRYLDYAK